MEGKVLDNILEEPQIKSKKIIDVKKSTEEDKKQNLEQDCDAFLNDIKGAETLEELQQIFDVVKKINFKDQPLLLKKLIDSKDEKKNELTLKKSTQSNEDFLKEYDAETGEIK
jgi:hypothetical protein